MLRADEISFELLTLPFWAAGEFESSIHINESSHSSLDLLHRPPFSALSPQFLKKCYFHLNSPGENP